MTTPQIAQGLASLGRNGDSVLVHMTPSEVAGLQSIAQANGTSLTINPDTGMPEAFSLGNLFNAILPVAAGALTGGAGAPLWAGIAAGGAAGALTKRKNESLFGSMVRGAASGYGGYNLGSTIGAMGAPTPAANPAGFENVANMNAIEASGATLNPETMSWVGGTDPATANMMQQSIVNAGGNISDPLTKQAITDTLKNNTYAQNLQNTWSNAGDLVTGQPGAWDAFKEAGGGLGTVALPAGGILMSAYEAPTPGMTQEEYDAERRRRFNQPLNLAAGKPLNLGTLAAKGGEIRLATGGAVAFDDGGSVPGSKLSLRREEEQMAPMQQMQPAQQMMQPAQTELGIAALKPGAENEVKIDITNAQLDPMQQEVQQVQPLAARAQSEGVPQLMQELGGQGVDFEKLYGRTQAPAPMAPMGGVRGFGPDGRRLAAGGSIQSGGVMDLYQGTDSQPTFGGDQGYGLGRLNNLASQQSMARAEQGNFARGGVPKLEDGGFVVPADVVFYLGNHNTEAGQKRLAKMYGARPIKGPGTGLSDSIPTSIEGQEPAKIANGEAYIPRKVVKSHGGPKKFYDMMAKVRKKATGSTKQARSA